MKDSNKNKISIIIPCRNEEKYIEGCLNSVLRNEYPEESIEVLIIDGKSTDSTRKIIDRFTNKYGFIYLLNNNNLTVPYAMNLGIKESSGDYIIRLDSHTEIPDNYFSELIKWSKKLDADNIGAVCITDVKDKNPKSNSIKKVLSSRLGVGNSYFRTGIKELKEVDTVPFGCYKKNIFGKIGLYDTRLTRNQDIELNKRLKNNNGKIFLIPDLFCKYFARENFSGIGKNNFGNGFWNVLTVYITKNLNSISVRHFVPLIFIFSLIIPLVLMIWYPSIGLISAFILILYSLITISISVKLKDRDSKFYFILWTFMTLHFSYGFGSLIGLFRIDYLFKSR